MRTTGAAAQFTDEELAGILGYSGTTNGAFQNRLNALRRLNLVTGRSSSMRLTPLARDLASGEPAAAARARVAAVLSEPFLARFVTTYAGRRLPANDALALELQDLGVPAGRAAAVARQTSDSLRACGLLRADRTVVSPDELKAGPADPAAEAQAELRAAVNHAVSRLPAPHDGWNVDDLDRWLYLLRAQLVNLYRLPVRLPSPGDADRTRPAD